MKDKVLFDFLTAQQAAAKITNEQSDLVEITALDGSPAQRYALRFRCRGLVKDTTGRIVEHDDFAVMVWLSDDYLRVADTFKNLFWVGPREVFHPNVSDKLPVICIGNLTAATPLIDIVHRVHEVITYHRYTVHEGLSLNHVAAAWARERESQFPVDRRPLLRERDALAFQLTEGSL